MFTYTHKGMHTDTTMNEATTYNNENNNNNIDECVVHQNYIRILKETNEMKMIVENDIQQKQHPLVSDRMKCTNDIECGVTSTIVSTDSTNSSSSKPCSGLGALLLDFIQCVPSKDITSSSSSSTINPTATKTNVIENPMVLSSFKSCNGVVNENTTSFDDVNNEIDTVDSSKPPPMVPIKASTSETEDEDDNIDPIHNHLEYSITTKKGGKQQQQQQQVVLHSDPFAPRDGRTLCWRNVQMKLSRRGKKLERTVLSNVWGEVPKTQTTAIMGASGAGKTSLLNILSGRVRNTGRVQIKADVRLDNYVVDPTNIKVRKSIAFVAQDDSLLTTATPREAIKFSGKMRLPRSTSDASIDILVTRMLKELGLESCADTIVGGPLIKGISGGERKRTSVGVELVVKPAMVFLDEPTSGLDSFSAIQVCQVLKKVANAGASVLFTIHQPSSEIFNSFDHLILLHQGRVMYQGSVQGIPSFFAQCGHPCPMTYNPADWIITVAQRNTVAELEQCGFYRNDERVAQKASVPKKGQNCFGQPIQKRSMYSENNIEKQCSLWTQVKILFYRELVHMVRFPIPLYGRFGFTTILSCLIGTIFWKVGEASASDTFNLTSQFGAMMILLMLAMLGTAQPALLFFPEERPIFLREYSTDHYSVVSYFISRLFLEMMNTGIQIIIMVVLIYYMVSFRGSLFMYIVTTYALAMSGTAMAVMLGVLSGGNLKFAQQLLPLLFIPQLLFSGFFVSPALIPKILQWAQYVCVLTYAVRMLVVEEFYNCSTNEIENRNCMRLVENVRADTDMTWFYWIMLVVYFIVFRLLALVLLQKSALKFY